MASPSSLPQSLDIRQNSDEGISNFWISGHGPVTKLEKRNKTTSKKIDDYVMSANFDVIVIFSIYGQFEAIRKTDLRYTVCKTYIFISSDLLSYKIESRTKKSLNSSFTIALSKGTIFAKEG